MPYDRCPTTATGARCSSAHACETTCPTFTTVLDLYTQSELTSSQLQDSQKLLRSRPKNLHLRTEWMCIFSSRLSSVCVQCPAVLVWPSAEVVMLSAELAMCSEPVWMPPQESRTSIHTGVAPSGGPRFPSAVCAESPITHTRVAALLPMRIPRAEDVVRLCFYQTLCVLKQATVSPASRQAVIPRCHYYNKKNVSLSDLPS